MIRALRRLNPIYLIAAVLFVIALGVPIFGPPRDLTGLSRSASVRDEGPAGMTVNSLASLSLDPMLVMVGFDLASRTLRAVERSVAGHVSQVADDHQRLVNRDGLRGGWQFKFQFGDARFRAEFWRCSWSIHLVFFKMFVGIDS